MKGSGGNGAKHGNKQKCQYLSAIIQICFFLADDAGIWQFSFFPLALFSPSFTVRSNERTRRDLHVCLYLPDEMTNSSASTPPGIQSLAVFAELGTHKISNGTVLPVWYALCGAMSAEPSAGKEVRGVSTHSLPKRA
jgi:hypothetical protein